MRSLKCLRKGLTLLDSSADLRMEELEISEGDAPPERAPKTQRRSCSDAVWFNALAAWLRVLRHKKGLG